MSDYKLTYWTSRRRDATFTLKELAEIARRFDYPGVARLVEQAEAGAVLDTAEREQISRMLELEQRKLGLGPIDEDPLAICGWFSVEAVK